MAVHYLFLLLVVSFSHSLAQSSSPPGVPSLFQEGVISTNLNERDMAISPDGNEMFYTLTAAQNSFSSIIYRKKLGNNTWTEPVIAPFSGMYADLEPAFSTDGSQLFFSSNRPLTGKTVKDYDIWVVTKVGGVWNTPENLGSPVNTDADEFYPSVSSSGNLYFTAEYSKSTKEDIHVSHRVNGAYTKSIPLDTAVNSSFWEFNAYVSPDEKFIIFTSFGRKDDQGGGDLYISTKDSDGAWKPAQNLKILNSAKLDYCPFVDADKKALYFTSRRHDMPSQYEKPVSFQELSKHYNGASNGSDNIHWVSLDTVMNSIK